MSVVRQPDLLAPLERARPDRVLPVEPFEFTGEGCEPDPTYVPPAWLRLPLADE